MKESEVNRFNELYERHLKPSNFRVRLKKPLMPIPVPFAGSGIILTVVRINSNPDSLKIILPIWWNPIHGVQSKLIA